MSFLYPAFLLGALAVAVPVVLHFLRRDVAPDVPFSAVRLVPRSPLARSRRRRLRDLLLLAARVAALLLLAAAFARPYVSSAAAMPAAIRIVAIDRSFSMGAPGRFAHALDLARRAVDEAARGERVALIAFDDRADLISGPGTAAEVRAALGGLQPGFGGTRYGPLLAKAAEVADGASGRLVIVSDLQRAGWEDEQRPLLPSGLELAVVDAGAPPPDLAVTGIEVGQERIVASLRNTGPDGRSGQVRLEHQGRLVASAPYRIAGDATADVAIAYRPPGSGSIAVSIDDVEGFAADNTRYAVLDPAPRQGTLVVTAGTDRSGFYLSRALAATYAGARDGMDVRVVAGEKLVDESLATYAAVALLSTRGVDRRARESLAAFVRAGGGLLVAAAPDIDPVMLSSIFDWRQEFARGDTEAEAPVALSVTDLRHPIFRPFGALSANLGQVRFDRTWRVRADGWDVIARFTSGAPALLERREGEGRVALFASDMDRRWNDFPSHPAFVPFVAEVVRYVSGVRERARDYPISRIPPGAEPKPGIYRVKPDGRAVAVNVDPRESTAATVRADEFEGLLDRLSPSAGGALDTRAQQTEARQSYWQYGLLLMLGALVAESFVGRA
jgi:hypothetical protein